MYEFLLALFSILATSSGSGSLLSETGQDASEYRAARYSMAVDYANAHDFMAENYGYIESNRPKIVVSSSYIIQYGDNVVIEILDPGTLDLVLINKWDYSRRKSSSTYYIRRAEKYRTHFDTILFSIEESLGSITDLCKGMSFDGDCDSLGFALNSGKDDLTVHFKDRIPNLRSHRLFYPDIKYLPYRIVGLGPRNNTLTLEEVISGKPAIDSLIQSFDYAGFTIITDQELNMMDRTSVNDLINRFQKFQERSDKKE
jgi:hypothetical protein